MKITHQLNTKIKKKQSMLSEFNNNHSATEMVFNNNKNVVYDKINIDLNTDLIFNHKIDFSDEDNVILESNPDLLVNNNKRYKNRESIQSLDYLNS